MDLLEDCVCHFEFLTGLIFTVPEHHGFKNKYPSPRTTLFRTCLVRTTITLQFYSLLKWRGEEVSVSESGEILAAFSQGAGDLSQVSELSQNSFMNSPLFR